MIRRKIDGWDDLRLDGALALIHRLVMLLTFPIRRFWLVFMILSATALIFTIIPLYFGAQIGHIGEWYKKNMPISVVVKKNQAISQVTDKVDKISEKVEKIGNTLTELSSNAELFSAEDYLADEETRFAKWNVGELKKADYKPRTNANPLQRTANVAQKTLHTLKQLSSAKVNVSTGQVKKDNSQSIKPHYPQAFAIKVTDASRNVPEDAFFYDGKLTDYYEYLENRDLIYTQKPSAVYGPATIVGPNSLYVNNTFLFLYGIYTDKRKFDVEAAEQYLQDLTANAMIYCALVAYTAQTDTATGLCFVNGIFINKSMVNHNLAINVGLK